MRELGVRGTQVLSYKNNNSNICPKFHITIKGRNVIEWKAYHWETYAYFKRHFHGGSKNTQSAAAAFAQLVRF